MTGDPLDDLWKQMRSTLFWTALAALLIGIMIGRALSTW